MVLTDRRCSLRRRRCVRRTRRPRRGLPPACRSAPRVVRRQFSSPSNHRTAVVLHVVVSHLHSSAREPLRSRYRPCRSVSGPNGEQTVVVNRADRRSTGRSPHRLVAVAVCREPANRSAPPLRSDHRSQPLGRPRSAAARRCERPDHQDKKETMTVSSRPKRSPMPSTLSRAGRSATAGVARPANRREQARGSRSTPPELDRLE